MQGCRFTKPPLPGSKERLALLWAREAAAISKKLENFNDAEKLKIAEGFLDGLAGKCVSYPGESGSHLPKIRPSFDPFYEQGYNVGEQFASAAKVFNHA